MNTHAKDLAQAIVEHLCADSVLAAYPPELIALAVVGAVPTLQGISQAQCQYVFDVLVGACAARQLARIEAKSARYIA
jgi:hypothetical protein